MLLARAARALAPGDPASLVYSWACVRAALLYLRKPAPLLAAAP
jgi:hypothetical protein